MRAFFLSLFLPLFLFGTVQEINSLDEVLPLTKDKNTLVIFRLGVLLKDDDSNKSPQVIAKLQENGVSLLAITSDLTGKADGVESLENKRIKSLKDLGMDFTKTCPSKTPIVFSELASNRGYYPTYFSGVLFSNGEKVPNCLLLLSYFNRSETRPDTIVYVDDNEDNLNQLESYLKYLGKPVDYHGLLFAR